jgi:hypothetical protein
LLTAIGNPSVGNQRREPGVNVFFTQGARTPTRKRLMLNRDACG